MTMMSVLCGNSFPSSAAGSWNYQRSVTITTTNTTNLQVRVALTTSNFDYSKAKSDGSDIRFTASSGADVASSALTYWNESWNTSGTSVFWVKIPNSSTSTIYMRYGNQTVSTASDIDNTMETGLRYRYYGVATGSSPSVPSGTLDGGGTDPSVNYSWQSGTVSVNGFGSRSDQVGVIWDGWVKPYGSGDHTFYCTSDDGQRLYIDTSLVINNWSDQGDTERSYLYSSWTDSKPRRIQYDFYENGGGATAKLGWEGPSLSKVYPIASTYLRSPKYSSSFNDPYSHTGTVGSETSV